MSGKESPRSALFRVAVFGDVVGKAGRAALRREIRPLRAERGLDLVIANGENASGGVGFDEECASELLSLGIDVVTLGDHTWHRKGVGEVLDARAATCVRPANYPSGAPGRGFLIWKGERGVSVGVFNLLGRVFLNTPLDCPFRKADELLAGPLAGCDLTVCDFHAEATSEKVAMGRYLDGRATLVVGTHTHVQTADEQILPSGTGYLTDLGMCGPEDSVIGMDRDAATARFLTGRPSSYKVGKGDAVLSGLLAEIDLESRRVVKLERVRKIVRV